MSFQPVLPLAGYAGWRFLSRTLPQQTEAMAARPDIARDMAHFRDRIGSVRSAEDLVSDFRMLRVALTAFGLQDDLPNRQFIRRILADSVTDPGALSNRLADKRYRDFSAAFGFGTSLPPRSAGPGFAAEILSRFQDRQFETAVGAQDPALRLALNAARELGDLAASDSRDSTLWFRIMGNPPLREVFETALGLPNAVGSLDLDRQLEIFRDKTERLTGRSDVAQFAEDGAVETLVRTYLTRDQLARATVFTSPASVALTLLQGAR